MDRTVALCGAYEQRTLDALTQPFVLPCTIVTGFLGAGKTTLLQSLLAKKRNLRLATLVNDFGRVNHDAQLLGLLPAAASSSSSSSSVHCSHGHSHDHPTLSYDRVKGLQGSCMCCSSELGQEMRGEVWDILQQQQQQEVAGAAAGGGGGGGVDYLVVETSGVTDPEAVIRALDEKFGKMTRARLDAVVTVVDADALHAEIEPSAGKEDGAAGTAAVAAAVPVALSRQLACADVILLNKCDLLGEDSVEAVEGYLRGINPLARVHRTRYCDVPLQYVLDVDLPDAGVGHMTHEATAAHYATRASRREQARLRSEASLAVSHKGKPSVFASSQPASASTSTSEPPHLAADGLASCTFEGAAPFRMHRLQAFLASAFSAATSHSIVRCKGFLHLRELPGRRLSLSVSGRRRFHLRDEGPWQSAPKSQVVLIGRGGGFDPEAQLAGLAAACEGDASEEEEGEEDGNPMSEEEHDRAAAAGAARVRALVAADARMELLDPRDVLLPLLRRSNASSSSSSSSSTGSNDGDADGPAWLDRMVVFRLTGAGALGVTSDHLRLQHGVDVDGLSRALQERVNLEGRVEQGPLLFPVPLPASVHGGGLALAFSVGGGGGGAGAQGPEWCQQAWASVIARAATAVMAERMSHLKLCKCGH